MVIKMNMTNPILPWLLLKWPLLSFVVYETAIEKRAMDRAKAAVLKDRWRLNQSDPLGRRPRNSDALAEMGTSTAHARKAMTP
jgi:hypothetical protein